MSMYPEDRIAFSAMADRPKFPLPDNGRIVVWPIVNVEYWSIERPMARQVIPPPTGVTALPDISNWSWHEYGMRVGFWRFLETFKSRGIKPTLSINAHVCEAYPRIAQAALDEGWEFMGHSDIQKPIHAEEDQQKMIATSVAKIKKFTGKPPVGWLGPGLTQTVDTVDYLHAAGIRYIADWVLDEHPCKFKTKTGEMVSLPYSVELNDVPMMAVRGYESPAFLTRVKDSFDRMWQEGKDQPRIMSIAIHPYLMGVSHRIRYLEEALDYMMKFDGVHIWNGEQILNWYESINDGKKRP